jgi:hypothetical protein
MLNSLRKDFLVKPELKAPLAFSAQFFKSKALVCVMSWILTVLGTVQFCGSVVFGCYTPVFDPMTFLMSHGFPTYSRISVIIGMFGLILLDCLAFPHEAFFCEFCRNVSS